jgi:signal transduction histidine kinase
MTTLGASAGHFVRANPVGALFTLILFGGTLMWLLTRPPDLPPSVPLNEVRWFAGSLDLQPRRARVDEMVGSLSRPSPQINPVQFSHTFDRTEIAAETPETAVFLPAVGGEVRIYFNNVILPGHPLEAGQNQVSSGTRAIYATIPPGYYHPGLNRLDITLRDAPNLALPGGIYFGDAAPLQAAADHHSFWQETLLSLLFFLVSSAVLLNICACFFRGWNSVHVALAIAALGLLLKLFLSASGPILVLGEYWALAERGALLILFSGVAGVFCKTRQTVVHGRPVIIALGLATALIIGAVMLHFHAPVVAAWLSATGLVISPLASVYPALSDRTVHLARDWPRGLATVLIFMIVAGLISGNLGWIPDRLSVSLEHLIAIGLVGGAAAAMSVGGWCSLTGVFRLVRSGLDIASLIQRQRQEIDSKSRSLEKELRHRAVLEERQRLVRDMHDGIGGQLISLLTRVRSKKIGLSQVERALRDGLHDLRLVVDSLDSAGDTLADALRTLESRVRPQVLAADIALDWVQPQELEVGAEDPRAILNLYRFLQEAISNAVRHSGARKLLVEITRDDAAKTISICVYDDGRGIPSEILSGAAVKGKGMSNLRQRAASLGGSLHLEHPARTWQTLVGVTVPITAFMAVR